MNFRTTIILFAVLLAMLWVFGLTVALKKNPFDESLILPSLRAEKEKPDAVVTINSITIVKASREIGESERLFFTRDSNEWRLKYEVYSEAEKSWRVLGQDLRTFNVDAIIDQVERASKKEDTPLERDLSQYRLDKPETTIIIKGQVAKKTEDKNGKPQPPAPGEPREWKFYIGKDKSGGIRYVNSSDRPRQPFAVDESSIKRLLDRVDSFRSPFLFEISEPTINSIRVAGKLDKQTYELELKKITEDTWRFVKPADYGLADTEGSPPDKLATKAPKAEGVKGLLDAIVKLRVADDGDFVPLEDSPRKWELDEEQETFRIHLIGKKDNDKVEDTLYVGKKEILKGEKKAVYYLRIKSNPGMAKVWAENFDPILKPLKEPLSLRNRDLLTVDTKKIDAVDLTHIKRDKDLKETARDTTRLRHKEHWQVSSSADKDWQKGGKRVIEDLLEALWAKRAVRDFLDTKDDKELGFDTPAAEVHLWVEGIDPGDKDKKTDKEKKADKKTDKDKKADKDKKTDAKVDPKKDAEPRLKKDAKGKEEVKPTVVLVFGKVKEDVVYVKRTAWIALPEDEKPKDKKAAKDKKEPKVEAIVTKLAVPKAVWDKLNPSEGSLAYLDTSLPEFKTEDVVGVVVKRSTEDEIPEFQVQRNRPARDPDVESQVPEWRLVKATDFAGRQVADAEHVGQMLRLVNSLKAKKWLPKSDPKDEAEKFAKDPVTVTVTIKKTFQVEPAASLCGLLAAPAPLAKAAAVLNFELYRADHPKANAWWEKYAKSKTTAAVVTGGKEVKEKDDKFVYAKHSDNTRLFLVSPDVSRQLRDIDVRDKSGLGLLHQALVYLSLWPTGQGMEGFLAVGPLFPHRVQHFAADKVKEIKLDLRTPYERRKFHFQRLADKTWKDIPSGLDEFKVNSEAVTKLVDKLADVKADRLVRLQRGKKLPKEYKLADMDKAPEKEKATAKIDLILEDGKTTKTITLTVGRRFDGGTYFAHTTAWEDAVFLLSSSEVFQVLNDPARFFGKDRVTAGP